MSAVSQADFDKVKKERDQLKDELRRLHEDLNEIKNNNPRPVDIAFVHASPQYLGKDRQVILNF